MPYFAPKLRETQGKSSNDCCLNPVGKRRSVEMGTCFSQFRHNILLAQNFKISLKLKCLATSIFHDLYIHKDNLKVIFLLFSKASISEIRSRVFLQFDCYETSFLEVFLYFLYRAVCQFYIFRYWQLGVFIIEREVHIFKIQVAC